MVELKPCPFCGGKVKIESFPPDEQYETASYYISCCECGSSTSFGYIYADKTARECTRKETVDKWNRRAETEMYVACAEWVYDKFMYAHCSECGYEHENPEYITPFCPGCGARMEDDKE